MKNRHFCQHHFRLRRFYNEAWFLRERGGGGGGGGRGIDETESLENKICSQQSVITGIDFFLQNLTQLQKLS